MVSVCFSRCVEKQKTKPTSARLLLEADVSFRKKIHVSDEILDKLDVGFAYLHQNPSLLQFAQGEESWEQYCARTSGLLRCVKLDVFAEAFLTLFDAKSDWYTLLHEVSGNGAYAISPAKKRYESEFVSALLRHRDVAEEDVLNRSVMVEISRMFSDVALWKNLVKVFIADESALLYSCHLGPCKYLHLVQKHLLPESVDYETLWKCVAYPLKSLHSLKLFWSYHDVLDLVLFEQKCCFDTHFDMRSKGAGYRIDRRRTAFRWRNKCDEDRNIDLLLERFSKCGGENTLRRFSRTDPLARACHAAIFGSEKLLDKMRRVKLLIEEATLFYYRPILDLKVSVGSDLFCLFIENQMPNASLGEKPQALSLKVLDMACSEAGFRKLLAFFQDSLGLAVVNRHLMAVDKDAASSSCEEKIYMCNVKSLWKAWEVKWQKKVQNIFAKVLENLNKTCICPYQIDVRDLLDCPSELDILLPLKMGRLLENGLLWEDVQFVMRRILEFNKVQVNCLKRDKKWFASKSVSRVRQNIFTKLCSFMPFTHSIKGSTSLLADKLIKHFECSSEVYF